MNCVAPTLPRSARSGMAGRFEEVVAESKSGALWWSERCPRICCDKTMGQRRGNALAPDTEG